MLELLLSIIIYIHEIIWLRAVSTFLNNFILIDCFTLHLVNMPGTHNHTYLEETLYHIHINVNFSLIRVIAYVTVLIYVLADPCVSVVAIA